jgi:hypothetical protein
MSRSIPFTLPSGTSGVGDFVSGRFVELACWGESRWHRDCVWVRAMSVFLFVIGFVERDW